MARLQAFLARQGTDDQPGVWPELKIGSTTGSVSQAKQKGFATFRKPLGDNSQIISGPN